MRRFLLRVIGLAAALVAAVLVWAVATLPPASQRPAASPAAPDLISGAYHIHSNRSDGSGPVDAIAAAAGRAGLRFIIITDHGDATRPPDPPAYRHGVLCVDAVEVSSAGGHVVALNLRSASPFPLAGETRDVIDDIHRMGGWAIAAHPDSPRLGLRWRAGDASVDGMEWLNVDSQWRGHSKAALVAAALHALFRPPETVAALFGPATAGLGTWTAALSARQVFTIAAVDAHARLGEDPDGSATSRPLALAVPGYETMFRTVAQTVRVARPLTGEAAADAAALLEAIAAGRSYSVVRAFIDAPDVFEFGAVSGSERVDLGGTMASSSPVTLRASVPAGIGARVVLLRDGQEVASGDGSVEFAAKEDGAYRAEARLAGRAVPWIVSNGIRVGGAVVPMPATSPDSRAPAAPATAIPLDSWVIESSPTSTAAIAIDRGELRLRYRLGAGEPAGQYVALASGASGTAAIERIEFTATSTRPMRVSVQIRLPGGVEGQRWRRSIYVDGTPRHVSVALSELDAVDRRSPLRPISARVQSVLLVIDTLNALPGSSGELSVRDMGYVPGHGEAGIGPAGR